MVDWSTQRVIVTGGAGFLGRAVVGVLHARGVRDERLVVPRAADCDLRRPEEAKRLVEQVAGGAPSTSPGEGERNRASPTPHPLPLGGGLTIIHCAGLVGGLGLNRARPADMLHDNLLMGLNVIHAAARASPTVKVVVVGSMTSYPASAPLPYREDSLFGGLPDPEIAAYGVAKLGLLAALRAYHAQYGLPSAFPILVNLYGPGDNIDDPLKSHAAGAIMKRFVDAARAGAPEVVCWGTGAPTRDFLFVDDAAEGVVRCTEEIDDASPINIASGLETSIKSLSEIIARHAGFTGRIVWDATKGDGVGRRCLDISRARERLGWSPRVGLDEGMRRTVEWYRANQPPRR